MSDARPPITNLYLTEWKTRASQAIAVELDGSADSAILRLIAAPRAADRMAGAFAERLGPEWEWHYDSNGQRDGKFCYRCHAWKCVARIDQAIKKAVR